MMALSGLVIIVVVLLLFLLVVAAIVVVAFALRSRNNPPVVGPSQPGSQQAALDILKERYARGEITREEYQAMRRDLEP